MELKDFLEAAINDFDNGGLKNKDFLSKAHQIYNAYANYSCGLPRAEHPYLHGIVFADFAKYYSHDINYYTSIAENALYCFSKVMRKSESVSERQCAAIRMLLFIDDNDWVMKGIAHFFIEKKCQELYGQQLLVHKMLAERMDPWVYETDILKNIGTYCLEQSSSCNHHSFISSEEMKSYDAIKNSSKYQRGVWTLARVSIERVFEMFSDFLKEFVSTPYERRVTMLRYSL